MTMTRSPLYQEHAKSASSMTTFCGWEMPLKYAASIFDEHLATRKFGGLFDISHMGRIFVSGKDAPLFLQYVLTNNAMALEPGQAQYTLIPNEKGGALDDAYLYRIDQNRYVLVVNAVNMQKDYEWLIDHKHRFASVELEDCTASIAMLALQGPKSKAVLETLFGAGLKLPGPARNTLGTIKVIGKEILISRTGYTGEPIGFELFIPAELVVSLWNDLLEVGSTIRVVPIGLGARDTLRIEAVLPLYGQEWGTDAAGYEIPILAGRMAVNFISFSKIKGYYIGRNELAKQFDELRMRLEGRLDKQPIELLVPRMMMPVLVLDERIARTGCEVYLDSTLVGHVTSGSLIPYWKFEGNGIYSKPGNQSGKRAISIAYIDANIQVGQQLIIKVRDKWLSAVVVNRHIASEAAPFARPILFKGSDHV
jgi:aminomethyltransferase